MVWMRTRKAHATAHTSRMALLIAAPSAELKLSTGRVISCCTVTVQVPGQSMTTGSATRHSPQDCLLPSACLCDSLEARGTSAKALTQGDSSTVHQREKQGTDEPAKNGQHGDALREQREIEFHHSTASSVRSTGVTIMVSPVSLSVMRNGLRV